MGRKPTGQQAMTNAERQKVYRDRRRGGPPGKKAIQARYRLAYVGVSRTTLWAWSHMQREIGKWAPELTPRIRNGELTILKAFRMAFMVAVESDNGEQFGATLPQSVWDMAFTEPPP